MNSLLDRMADHPGVRYMVSNGYTLQEAIRRQQHFDLVAADARKNGLLPGQWSDSEIIDD